MRHLERLPAKVHAAAIELITNAIAAEPRRVGKPLVGELARLRSARRSDDRVIYEVDDDTETVVIHRVQHRRDVCRRR